jgi:hypothetical protein
VVRQVLGRFLAQVQVTERELRRFLRAALLHRERRRLHPAFADIEGVDRFFGRACVAFRLERWRAAEAEAKQRQERAQAEREEPSNALPPAEELEAMRSKALGTRDAAAIGHAVAGLLRRGRP